MPRIDIRIDVLGRCLELMYELMCCGRGVCFQIREKGLVLGFALEDFVFERISDLPNSLSNVFFDDDINLFRSDRQMFFVSPKKAFETICWG